MRVVLRFQPADIEEIFSGSQSQLLEDFTVLRLLGHRAVRYENGGRAVLLPVIPFYDACIGDQDIRESCGEALAQAVVSFPQAIPPEIQAKLSELKMKIEKSVL